MFQEQKAGRGLQQNEVSKEQMEQRGGPCSWVRILTNYKKPEVDDKQKNDPEDMCKGGLWFQVWGGGTCACISSSSLLPFGNITGRGHREPSLGSPSLGRLLSKPKTSPGLCVNLGGGDNPRGHLGPLSGAALTHFWS